MNNKSLFFLNRLRGFEKDLFVGKNTDICVEGFQRSGNNFVTFLIKKYNRGIKISSHLHASINALNAVENNIPTLVLIRQPRACIASLIAWDKNLSVKTALKAYINFYKVIFEFQEAVVVADFSDVISAPSKIIDAVNKKYKTDFICPDLDKETLDKLLSVRKQKFDHLGVASPFPHKEKQTIKASLEPIIEQNEFYPHAQRIYKKIIAS